jgi:hypothetical protein
MQWMVPREIGTYCIVIIDSNHKTYCSYSGTIRNPPLVQKKLPELNRSPKVSLRRILRAYSAAIRVGRAVGNVPEGAAPIKNLGPPLWRILKWARNGGNGVKNLGPYPFAITS